jgi:hypothetical protein
VSATLAREDGGSRLRSITICATLRVVANCDGHHKGSASLRSWQAPMVVTTVSEFTDELGALAACVGLSLDKGLQGAGTSFRRLPWGHVRVHIFVSQVKNPLSDTATASCTFREAVARQIPCQSLYQREPHHIQRSNSSSKLRLDAPDSLEVVGILISVGARAEWDQTRETWRRRALQVSHGKRRWRTHRLRLQSTRGQNTWPGRRLWDAQLARIAGLAGFARWAARF